MSLLKRLAPEGSLEQLQESLEADSGAEILESFSIDHGSSKAIEGLDVLIQQGPDGLNPQLAESLEAVVHLRLRPAINIVNDRFGQLPPGSQWSWLAEPQTRARIERNIRSIGRIELPGKAFWPFAGTGFVVGPNLVMTNRHVAEIFAERGADSLIRFRSSYTANINFLHEAIPRENETEQILAVKAVVMLHSGWDMALLRVAGLSDRQVPLQLSTTHPDDLTSRDIVVIGYPQQDDRGDINEHNRIFGGMFGVKRMLPGRIGRFEPTVSLKDVVEALTHDASTLGGNSGSAVIHVATGEVLGLHFAGEYLKTNYAVATKDLSQDNQVIDQGVNFVLPQQPRIEKPSPLSVRSRVDAEASQTQSRNKASAKAPALGGADDQQKLIDLVRPTEPGDLQDSIKKAVPGRHDVASHLSGAASDGEIPVSNGPLRNLVVIDTAHVPVPPPEALVGSSVGSTGTGITKLLSDAFKMLVEALSPFTIQTDLQATVWYIEAHFPGQPTQSGSAVMIRLKNSDGRMENALLTCQHVVRHTTFGNYSGDIRCWRHNDGYHPLQFWQASVLNISGSTRTDVFEAKVAGGKDWVLLSVEKLGQMTNGLPFAPGFAGGSFTKRFWLVGYPGGTATMARCIVKADVSREFRLSRLDTNTGTVPLAGSERTGGGFSGGPYLKGNGKIVALHRNIRSTNQRPVGVNGMSILSTIKDKGWDVVEVSDKTPMKWSIRVVVAVIALAIFYFSTRAPDLTITAIEGKECEFTLSSDGYMIQERGPNRSLHDPGRPPDITGKTFHWKNPIFKAKVEADERVERFVSTSQFSYGKSFLGIPLPVGTITVRVRHHHVFKNCQELHEALDEDLPDKVWEWYEDPELRPLITINFTVAEKPKLKYKTIEMNTTSQNPNIILVLTTEYSVMPMQSRTDYLTRIRNSTDELPRDFRFEDVYISNNPQPQIFSSGTWIIHFER